MYNKFILVTLLAVVASSSAFAAPTVQDVLANIAASKRVVNQPSPVIGTQAMALGNRRVNRDEAIDRVHEILDDRRRTPPASP